MSIIVSMLSAHPLVGQWVAEDDQGAALYTVQAEGGHFAVTVSDQRSKEPLEVQDVGWDGGTLRFSVFTHSTGWRVQHALTALPDGRLDDQVNAQSRSVLIRRSPKG
jgi:hypothetical protein